MGRKEWVNQNTKYKKDLKKSATFNLNKQKKIKMNKQMKVKRKKIQNLDLLIDRPRNLDQGHVLVTTNTADNFLSLLK